jgi:exonuclease SbcD
MRVLHVSDLHLGRELLGVSRQREHEALVAELVAVAETRAVDLTVIAGDVFDTVNPPAWAEDAFYGLVDGLAAGGRRAVVVVAGNHDNAMRLAAAQPLAARAGIWLCGELDAAPRAFTRPGYARLEPLGPGAALVTSADGERRVAVGALPFVSEARLVRLQRTEVEDEATDRDAYADALARAFAARKACLPDGVPHLLIGHLWVSGGAAADSERVYRIGGLSDLRAGDLPGADYLALGHLHRPQSISGAPGPGPVVYSGSPLAWSASETGQQKRIVLVDLPRPGETHLESVPVRAGRPVREWTVRSEAELDARVAAEVRESPIVFLRVDYGRVLSRDESSGLHRKGVTFVDVRVRGEATAEVDDPSDAFADGLPEDVLLETFLGGEGHNPAYAAELAADLLALLRDEPPALPAEALDEVEA